MVSTQMDYVQIIGHSSLMVKFVLLLLLFFSIASWSIIFIKVRYLHRSFKESEIFIDYFWKSRDLASAFTKAKQLTGSPVARIFRTAYTELRKLTSTEKPEADHETEKKEEVHAHPEFSSSGNVERALRRAINIEMTQLGQMVPFLATTGNTTPFIGLFGTVWGIMDAFHGIGLRGSASLAVVAPGISEALVATAAGLAVAIPAVIAFNHFMQKIRVMETDLNSFSADFLNILDRDILR
ncbi:protein TolQ [Desulfosarcina sp. OttesenSCG-928-A07]|nr:protein TolQ [Desulfosarcina sp. OttesenSCG-928-A07]